MPPHTDHHAFLTVIASLERRITRLEAPTGGEQAQTVKRLAETIARQPVLAMHAARTHGFALTGGWATYVNTKIIVPPDKTHATITGIASAGMLDTKTGGTTTVHARVVIAGAVGETFPATKDAGASRTNNVIYATHQAELTVTPGSPLHVAVQIRPLNADAFKEENQNFAHITAIASFTGEPGLS